MESFIHDHRKQIISNRNKMEFSIARVADALVSQSTMLNCAFEVVWKKYMHSAITEQVSYEDAISYINDKMNLGQRV